MSSKLKQPLTDSKSPKNHAIAKASFEERAQTAPHPLTAYLLRLMALKKSNLCLSADVSSISQLLSLASSLGPYIVVLKTHYDLVSNWDYSPVTGTGARLQKLARKHGFLIFEDRKFGDIGNTVQLQYTEGTARIIEWANITNVNMVPGAAVVDALADAAVRWRERKQYEVKTDISTGTPRDSDEDDEEDSSGEFTPVRDQRKASIVSITTVSQRFEPANSPRSFVDAGGEAEEVLQGIEEAPMERGLLILAQMSSVGHFMTGEYTQACVEAARRHKTFVMGYISQETLNSEPGDEFLSMTPGCQLPPEGEDEDAEIEGDGKGQQYNTPQKLINMMGNDIAIVGRGIIKADDPVKAAKRYRRKAWEAYQERIFA